VPDSIGGEADDPGGPAELPGDDAIAGLMAMVAFEPQDVQDTLCEFFDWTAERFKSDHWRLTERQARMLGKPTSLLLNSLWARLCLILPDIIAASGAAAAPSTTVFSSSSMRRIASARVAFQRQRHTQHTVVSASVGNRIDVRTHHQPLSARCPRLP